MEVQNGVAGTKGKYLIHQRCRQTVFPLRTQDRSEPPESSSALNDSRVSTLEHGTAGETPGKVKNSSPLKTGGVGSLM